MHGVRGEGGTIRQRVGNDIDGVATTGVGVTTVRPWQGRGMAMPW